MKKGFTLAEILVTLAIIGVVAALTVPSVLINYQKEQTISKLKKAYNTLNMAFQQSKYYSGGISNAEAYEMDPDVYFEKHWQPYLKDPKRCDGKDANNKLRYKNCGYSTVTPWNKPGSSVNSNITVNYDKEIAFVTDDEIFYGIRTGSGNDDNRAPSTLVFVDLNAGKRPNVLGKDVFVFKRVEKEGVIRPFCYDKTEEEINNGKYYCKKGGVGYCCAYDIIKAGWKLPDNYPW